MSKAQKPAVRQKKIELSELPAEVLRAARAQLGTARLLIRKKAPYFETALLKLVPVPIPGFGTYAVTDRMALLYDPLLVINQEVNEVAGCLLHELMHILLSHSRRQKTIDAEPDKWNMAGDLEINDDLKAGKWQLPEWVLYPEKYGLENGELAESYYGQLPDPPKRAGSGAGEGEDGGGEGEEDEDSDGDGQGRKPCDGQCGSGAGNRLPDEPDDKGRTPQEVERTKNQTAKAVAEHAQKNRGTVPGGLLRWAESQIEPAKIPWDKQLQRVARRAVAFRSGPGRATYTRLNRKQAGLGFGINSPRLPSFVRNIPNVLFIGDTSGSMGTEELKRVIAEAKGVMDAIEAPMTWMACDAATYGLHKVDDPMEIIKLIKGGGGTDFRPAFKLADELKPKPNIIIFATDGMGPAPAEKPVGMDVIWLLIGPYKQRPCEWGTVIEVDDD